VTPQAQAESVGAPSCVACAGIGAWNAARQDVVCQSCGNAIDMPPARVGPFDRFALLPRLRDRPDNGRDWQPRATHLRCRSCQALIAYDAHIAGGICQACGTPGLVPSDATGAPVTPSGILPFLKTEADARASLHEHLRSRRTSATVETMRALYVPCWMFDASVSCRWRGERKGSGGERIGIDGVVERVFESYTFPASLSLDARRMTSCGPFPAQDVRPYDTRYLAGCTVEIYTTNMWDAWDAVSGGMQKEIDAQLRADSRCSPAALETWPEWTDQRGAQVLVPIYLMTCRGRKHSFEAVVNGWNGNAAANVPINWVATVAVLAALLAIAAGMVYGVVRLLW
jgi:hypothetical protein